MTRARGAWRRNALDLRIRCERTRCYRCIHRSMWHGLGRRRLQRWNQRLVVDERARGFQLGERRSLLCAPLHSVRSVPLRFVQHPVERLLVVLRVRPHDAPARCLRIPLGGGQRQRRGAASDHGTHGGGGADQIAVQSVGRRGRASQQATRQAARPRWAAAAAYLDAAPCRGPDAAATRPGPRRDRA